MTGPTAASHGPRLCHPVAVPPDRRVAAAFVAHAENADNVPRLADRAAAPGMHPQELAGLTTKFWKPGTTLRIRFLRAVAARLRSDILGHANAWRTEAGAHIFFREADPGEFAEVRIDFIAGAGSYSYLGTDCLTIPQPQHTMNLGWIDDSTDPVEVRRVVRHEFGHVLALEHEFQLALALGAVKVNRPAVYADFAGPPNYWSAAEVDAQVLDKLDMTGVVHSDFDPTSLMEYWMRAEWFDPPVEVPGNTTFSARDRANVAKWYPGPAGPVTPPAPAPAAAPDFPRPDPADPLGTVWRVNDRLGRAVNAARRAHGSHPLASFHIGLAGVAGLQAARCVAAGGLTHARPGYPDAGAEYRHYGADIALEDPRPGAVIDLGECVFYGPPWPDARLAPTAASVVAAWLGDPPHRLAVLAARPTHCGFGWAYDARGGLYVVGAFGRPAA
jgi:serralysin